MSLRPSAGWAWRRSFFARLPFKSEVYLVLPMQTIAYVQLAKIIALGLLNAANEFFQQPKITTVQLPQAKERIT
jgi:hypothetical protein